MANIQLQVDVVKTQLEALKKEVNALNGTKIKIDIDASGLEAIKGLTSAQARYLSNLEKTKQKEAIARAEELKLTRQREAQAGATGKATTANKDYDKSLQQTAKDTKELTGLSKILGDSLGNIVAKIITWQVVNATVATVIRSFKDAVATMKEVDTQLTNIAKVSDMSAASLQKLGDSAYDVASKYGVASEEYLSAVYTFTKAGLGDDAAAMAELATKTMLVGDTTADVASKFLIAANAAWGYNGSIDALNKVVDETDYVNNNYATDLEKLADAMPIVASTAANMNLTFEETLALLGTINSKTQETGRKTATAVRSFLIAISGQVGEFVDDVGETYEVTTENIEALTGALKLYGNEAVQSAIKTGEIINPMEALNSLAQAYKDGLLNDIELQEILIKVAGKMRYNQLVTIVKDLASETSTYRDILSGLGDAAGTADAEVSTMLSSWESKTQILKNTWTQFLTNFINSDAIKGGLDILIGAVKLLDGDFAKFAATVGIAFVALKGFTSLKVGLTGLSTAADILNMHFHGMSDAMIAAKLNMEETEVASKRLNTTLGLLAMAIGVVIYSLSSAKRKTEELRQAEIDTANESINAYHTIAQLKTEYENAAAGSDEAKTAADNLTKALEEQGYAVRNLESDYRGLIDAQRQKAEADTKAAVYAAEQSLLDKALSSELRNVQAIEGGYYDIFKYLPDFVMDIGAKGLSLLGINAESAGMASVESLLSRYDAAKEALTRLAPDSDEYAALAAFVNLLKDEVEQYRELQGVLNEIDDSKAKEEAIDFITSEDGKALREVGKIIEETFGKTDEESRGRFKNAVRAVHELTDELVRNGQISQEAAKHIAAYFAQVAQGEEPTNTLISAITDENGKLTETAAEAMAADSALLQLALSEAKAALAAAQANYYNLVTQLGNVTSAALSAAAAMAGYWMAASLGTGVGAPGQTGSAGIDPNNIALAREKYKVDQAQALVDQITLLIDSSTSTTSGGGGGGGSSKSALQQSIENEIALLKAELALMKERGATETAQVEKIRQIQSALKVEAEYLAKIGASQEEIYQIEREWWSYQDEIADIRLNVLKSELALMKERGDSAEDQIAKAKEIQAALRDQIDALKEIGASQTEINQLEKEWWSYENDIAEKTNQLAEDRLTLEEKILAVQEAQAALMNAQNERTVRTYNATTGKWGWTQNASNVRAAQEKLDSATKNLADYYTEHPELQGNVTAAVAANATAGIVAQIPDAMLSAAIGAASGATLQDVIPAAGAINATIQNIGTQNNGNVYYFGGITFTEAQAESMTLKQLAEQSRSLRIYSGTY